MLAKIAINVLILCLIGFISFVHVRLGLLRLRNNPNSAESKTNIAGVSTTKIVSIKDVRNTVDAHTEANKTGIPVKISCKSSLARRTCHGATGRD